MNCPYSFRVLSKENFGAMRYYVEVNGCVAVESIINKNDV